VAEVVNLSIEADGDGEDDDGEDELWVVGLIYMVVGREEL
jgi:hypothetical protein